MLFGCGSVVLGLWSGISTVTFTRTAPLSNLTKASIRHPTHWSISVPFSPGWPSAPFSPGRPSVPLAPSLPGGPCGPVGPGGPCAPVLLSLSLSL